jgi:hypothetical protein
MPEPGLASEIAAFLDAHIDSIPQMEILMLLHDGRTQAWPADVIAARIYQPVAAVLPLLRGLQAHGLVTLHESAETPLYRYDDRPETRQVMLDVAAAYRSQLIEVTRFVHAKASRSVLEFARAFDFKKDRP